MFLTDRISLAILGLAWGAQVFLRSLFVRRVKFVFFFSICAIFGVLLFWTLLQYLYWRNSYIGRFLLPPYQPISYFLTYAITRLRVGGALFGAFAAILFGYIASFYNRRFGERFFEPEEPFLFALCSFLVGYPGFLFYLLVLLLSALLLAIFYSIRGMGRVPLYFLWFPAAIFVILIQNWVFPQWLLASFNF